MQRKNWEYIKYIIYFAESVFIFSYYQIKQTYLPGKNNPPNSVVFKSGENEKNNKFWLMHIQMY
jgi:hypothetical protein